MISTIQVPFRNRSLTAITNNIKGATSILFLHGNSCSSKSWEHQFNSTLGDKYNLIAFEFLGFGDSDRSESPADDYSITALKESVMAVVNHFRLTDYYLVGHSLGGHVIAQTVDQLPGCKGMMSIGAPPISLPPRIDDIYLKTAPTNVMFFKDCTDEDLQVVEDNFFYSADRMPEFFKSDFKKTDGYARESIGAILGSDQFQDEVNVLSKSQVPKAFICGEHERAINNRYYDTLDFPNTWQNKLHEIPNAAHFPQWENPEAFNELVERFIEGN